MEKNGNTYPLKQSQVGVYIECMEHQGEIYYNMPYLYVLEKDVIDIEKLKISIEKAIFNHPNFFSRFITDEDGIARQVLREPFHFDIPVIETDDIEREKRETMIRPFNLLDEKELLFRFAIYYDQQHLYLLVDVHHLIGDGTTYTVLFDDINKAYFGEEMLPEEKIYVEFSLEEEAERQSPVYEEAKKWYHENFDAAEEVSSVLTPDREEKEIRAIRKTIMVEGLSYADVRDYCHSNKIKGSAFFTSAFGYLLSRYNGEEQSLFATIYNGRDKEKIGRTAGFFVKTYPVYSHFNYTDNVIDYIRESQVQLDGARENSLFSFGDVMTQIGLQPSIFFVYHGKFRSESSLFGSSVSAQRVICASTGEDMNVLVFQQGDGYSFEVEYQANKFSDELIEHFMDAYVEVLKGMLTKQTLGEITLLSEKAEKKLDTFFGPQLTYDDTQTVVSLFKKSAAAYPDQLCVNYQDKSYTYQEVDELSDRVAAYIVGKGVQPESVVSVMLNRCAWMVIVSLGVMKAGCAYQPLDPSYPADRLNFMMNDAGAQLLIADRDLRPVVDEYQGEVLYADELDCLSPKPSTLSLPEVKPEYTYILLYTSGSTGVPKGVMLCHANIVSYDFWYQKKFQLDHTCHTAPYASYGFDAFMIDTYPALACGASIYIVPEEIRLDMEALNQFILDNKITHTLMTTQVGCQFAMNMENESLRYLLTGGEKILSFDPPKSYQLINAYGPTENTISITCFPVTEKLNNVPIGEANDNMRLYIVDKLGQRVPVGCSGELWAAGPQIGKGYLNLPEKTAEAFVQNPFATEKPYDRAYRTGDTVCWRSDGNVLFLGRKDGQVKIRGFRIELKEVEGIIREFKGIKDVTVQAFDADGGGKFIAAYIVSDEQVDIQALNNFIMETKPPYMVPAVTMQIEKIPLNVNQKVDKKALPKPEVKSVEVEESNVPLNILETQIKEVIASVVHTEEFGLTTPLVYVGLTSISCIQLAVKIYKKFGVKIDTKNFAKTGTLQQIENEVLELLLAGGTTQPDGSADTNPDGTLSPKPSTPSSITSAPLTYPQKGVYFECLKDPIATTYNIPFILKFPQSIANYAIVSAVKDTVLAHQSMRIIFVAQGNDIVQQFCEDMPIDVAVAEMTEDELMQEKAQFMQPFNLAKGPLFRFKLIVCGEHKYLFTDIHHLVTDGASEDLFIHEICNRLEGVTPEVEDYSYLQFASDQNQAEGGEAYLANKAYFDERLSLLEGASEIPADMPKNSQHNHEMGAVKLPIDFVSVEKIAKQMGVTPMSIYLSALFYTVSRYVNNKQVGIGTISSGRSNLQVHNTTGMFVNTLALGQVIGEQTVEQFIREVAANFSDTLAHEDYPFAQVAADYGFQPEIMFTYQVGVISQLMVQQQVVELEVLALKDPKFKIDVSITNDENNNYLIKIDYDKAYYTEDLVSRLAESLDTVAQRLIANLTAPVKQISIMSDRQKSEVEAMYAPFVEPTVCHRFFQPIEEWAAKDPDRKAIIACDRELTYGEFNAEINRTAHALIARGVKHGDRVIILLPRDSRALTSIFGVSKCGAAYIPCDPNYPADRIKLILEDSDARYIITTAEHVAEHGEKAILVDDLKSDDATNPNVDISPHDLAYVLYTSGSTGRPKGVMLHHEGICNYCCIHPKNPVMWACAQEAHAILSITTLSFDMSVHEYGCAFFGGLTFVFANEQQTNNPLELARLFRETGADALDCTPSRILSYTDAPEFLEAMKQVKVVDAGGEPFSPILRDRLKSVMTGHIFNIYGPTEITVACNAYDLQLTDDIHVGPPTLNYSMYVVDQDGNELPVGVIGELYIGGVGVTLGYNNLPEQNADRFIEYHGERVYRSGDYARWTPDGSIVIHGRMDGQIKLRGLRIELGEVESVIAKYPGVQKVAAKVCKIQGKEHLSAYFIADRKIDIQALKAEIGKTLTQYMVPTAYLQMDKFPMTPNGKTDMKHLPQPVVEVNTNYVAAANDTEQQFCDLFAEILGLDKVGATDNFFELGGTSLLITRVLIGADKLGYKIPYGEIFKHASPRQLSELLGKSSAEPVNDKQSQAENFDYNMINGVLVQNKIENFLGGEMQSFNKILLTGATGYLGMHILNELLKTDAEKIYCLVRGKSEKDAKGRLKTLLFYYFDTPCDELFDERLFIVRGDVTADILSLDERLSEVDTVFNCAALVKHFSEGTEIEDINIGGVEQCIRFCQSTGARLVHVSTESTRGSVRKEQKWVPYTETVLYQHQDLSNQYVFSKFMGERLILDAISKGELSAKIMRVGNLAARNRDGEFQINFETNSYMGRLRVFQNLGVFPVDMYDKKIEFSPIDQVAEAIVMLAQTPKDCTVFHPYNNHTILLGDVVAELENIGTKVALVENDIFNEAMQLAGTDQKKAQRLVSLVAYQNLANAGQMVPVDYNNEYTMKVLHRLGFKWSLTTFDYVRRFLHAINDLGYFDI